MREAQAAEASSPAVSQHALVESYIRSTGAAIQHGTLALRYWFNMMQHSTGKYSVSLKPCLLTGDNSFSLTLGELMTMATTTGKFQDYVIKLNASPTLLIRLCVLEMLALDQSDYSLKHCTEEKPNYPKRKKERILETP